VALWPRVLERVKEHSRVAWLLVRDCRPVSLSNSILTLTQSNAGAVAAFNQGGHAERIRQALLDELRMELTVEMTLGSNAPEPAQPKPPEPAPAAPEDEPADDDESLEASAETGLELLQRELGGHKIAEYENE
jgi:DNA polymerase-3 subunit gamma/tau